MGVLLKRREFRFLVALLPRDVSPSTGLRWSPGEFVDGLLRPGRWRGPGDGVMFGISPKAADLTSSTRPVALLRSDRNTLLTTGLVPGLVFGLAIGLAVGGLPGLAGGFVFGLALVFQQALMLGFLGRPSASAWFCFVLARAYLAVRHQTPWRLMSFLKDAHRHRGVLRQVGPVYQFRHIDLQRHLAQQHH